MIPVLLPKQPSVTAVVSADAGSANERGRSETPADPVEVPRAESEARITAEERAVQKTQLAAFETALPIFQAWTDQYLAAVEAKRPERPALPPSFSKALTNAPNDVRETFARLEEQLRQENHSPEFIRMRLEETKRITPSNIVGSADSRIRQRLSELKESSRRSEQEAWYDEQIAELRKSMPERSDSYLRGYVKGQEIFQRYASRWNDRSARGHIESRLREEYSRTAESAKSVSSSSSVPPDQLGFPAGYSDAIRKGMDSLGLP